MSLYRVRIRLRAPLGTPLTSGTIFGHLCWAWRDREGEASLARWLASLPEAPWAVSDGLPADRLPRPLLTPVPPPRPMRLDEPRRRALEREKELARAPWVGIETWRQLRAGLDEAALRDALAAGGVDAIPDPDPVRVAHNTIDRRTGTTPERAGLYFVVEDWTFAHDDRRDVYVRADAPAERIRALFADVGARGYGRDASIGRGVFAVDGVTDVAWLDDIAGNRMMSLSHGTVSANMAAPRYRLFTHFGKVGIGVAAAGARPWKRPILLARPGATFAPADAGPYGAWLADVHQDRAEVGHNGFHLAVPFVEKEAVS